MQTHSREFPVKSMAKLFGVSRSGYYKYLKSCKENIKKYDPYILNTIMDIWLKNKKTYGLIRLLKALKKIDNKYGARRLRKMMNLLEIKGKQEKKFRIVTTNSNHTESVARDLVKRNFCPNTKNKVWASDVTYIRTLHGWAYLCVIMDLYSRKIVSWKVSESNDTKLVMDTMNQALQSRCPNIGLVFHSDRGSNYCALEFQDMLKRNGIIRSNSRKGNCWDNAVVESFFSSLKREMDYNIFYDKNDLEYALFEYIEIFYNRQRMHSFLGYKSPCEYETMAA